MNESNSFQDVLRRVLVPEKKVVPTPKPKRKVRSAYVSEAMGTSSPTNVTASTQAGGAQGLPPFSKASADSRSSSIDMRDIGRDEDRKAKEHKGKPYPLDTIMDLIAHSGEDLTNAKTMIEISLSKNNVSLTPEQKNILKDAHQTIKSSLGNIGKAAKSINSITIG